MDVGCGCDRHVNGIFHLPKYGIRTDQYYQDSVLSEQRARWPSLPSLILSFSNSNSFTSIADCFIASHLSIDHNEADDEEEPSINISTSTPIRIPISELSILTMNIGQMSSGHHQCEVWPKRWDCMSCLIWMGKGRSMLRRMLGILLGLTSILNSMIHLCVGMRTPCRNLAIIHVWCKYPYCLLYTGKSISTVGHGQSMFLWICGSSNTANKRNQIWKRLRFSNAVGRAYRCHRMPLLAAWLNSSDKFSRKLVINYRYSVHILSF